MNIHVIDKEFNNHSYYVNECYLLDIKVKDHHNCAGWTLRSVSHYYEGSDINALINTLHNLINSYKLVKHNKHSCDYLLIYVDDLTKIRGFLYNFIYKSDDHDMYINVFDCIEFRSYKHWTKDKDVAFETMNEWFNTFKDDKYMYFTPSQLNRKRIAKIMKNRYEDEYPDERQYYQIMKAIHGGVLYYNKIPATTNMIGLDITSAYIYGLLFCKQPMSKPENTDPDNWESYLGKDDVGSIGTYEIEYIHPINNIGCYKDINDQPLKTGHHTVKITLTNIDLKLLFDMKYMQIVNCKCLYLIHYKMDYAPKEFRDYCIDSYITKCSKLKGTIAYKNAKKSLNSIFGNLIQQVVQRTFDEEYKASKSKSKALKAASKAYKFLDKSTRPEWGVFTMAYCKKLVYTLGLQVAGWRYSDTDSIYCDDDSANRVIVDQFNNKIMSENYALCEKLDYTDYNMDLLCKLGTFDLEAEIETFRVWGNKTYAYKTLDGKYVIKAAGCNKEELPTDDSIFTDPNYKPQVGTRIHTYYDETGYYEKISRNNNALLNGILRS